jgi:hypothetical protein
MTVRRARVAPSPTGEKIRAYARAYAAAGQKERAEGMIQAADTVDGDFAGTTTGLVEDSVLLSVVLALTQVTDRLTEAVADMRAGVADAVPVVSPKPVRESRSKAAVSRKGPGELTILTAVAQLADGATRQQLTVLTQYKTSTRNTYIQRLRQRGLVTDTDRVRATDAGRAELGPDFRRLPTGAALVEQLRAELPPGEWSILGHLLDRSPLNRDEIGHLTGFKTSTRNTYIQRLRARELVYTEGDLLYPDEQLTDGG